MRAVYLVICLVLALGAAAARAQSLPQIKCEAGYQATIYAAGLDGPDGLAFHPQTEVLYVAEETCGRVSRITAAGRAEPVLTDLQSPEGIAFDAAGNLYVVEDVRNGRLLRQTPTGALEVLRTGLDAPEGVAIAPEGTIYFTESNAQIKDDPRNFRTRVSALAPMPPFGRSLLFTARPKFDLTGTVTFTVEALSFAGITVGADQSLYVTNEASRGSRSVAGVNFVIASTKSIVRIDRRTAETSIFVEGLTSAEGLRFASDGQFPLYVVEENVPGDETGRLDMVDRFGQVTTLCKGFGSLEDVVVDTYGNLYVSEDNTGYVILLYQPALAKIGRRAAAGVGQ